MCSGPSLVVVLERDNAASCFQLVLKRSAIYDCTRNMITLKHLATDHVCDVLLCTIDSTLFLFLFRSLFSVFNRHYITDHTGSLFSSAIIPNDSKQVRKGTVESGFFERNQLSSIYLYICLFIISLIQAKQLLEFLQCC